MSQALSCCLKLPRLRPVLRKGEMPLCDGATEDGLQNLVRTMVADGKYLVRTGCGNCDKLIRRKEPDVYFLCDSMYTIASYKKSDFSRPTATQTPSDSLTGLSGCDGMTKVRHLRH